jgi:hypothetical protein
MTDRTALFVAESLGYAVFQLALTIAKCTAALCNAILEAAPYRDPNVPPNEQTCQILTRHGAKASDVYEMFRGANQTPKQGNKTK